MGSGFYEKDFLACCGSTKFAREMAAASPFPTYERAVEAARDIWFNKVDVNGWLEAFAAHPPELVEWNNRYMQKFGFVFLICASGRSTPEILEELKKRYPNRPIVEFEIAAQEEMKIIELRLAKLFAAKAEVTSTISTQYYISQVTKAEEDRVSIIGAHLTAASEVHGSGKASQNSARTRPPITTHVLDVSRGSPAAGIEVQLEMWKGSRPFPLFGELDSEGWILQGSSFTNSDGRSGQLMGIVESVDPGFYRISFNTGKYSPSGFFPYVSIVFEIKESQRLEHFHVPLLLSPFSFTTYRGS